MLPGRALELIEGTNRLGRGPSNDIRISEPSVSICHCVVTVSASGVWVADLGSTNGSFIDGEPIRERALHPGQTLQLGTIQFVLEMHGGLQGSEPAVSIPLFSHPVEPMQTFLSDGTALCLAHPKIVAGFKCTRCQFAYCEECVRTVGISGGKSLFFCPECDGKCFPLELPPPPMSISDRFISIWGVLANTFKMLFWK